jgi:hypothetical protein
MAGHTNTPGYQDGLKKVHNLTSRLQVHLVALGTVLRSFGKHPPGRLFAEKLLGGWERPRAARLPSEKGPYSDLQFYVPLGSLACIYLAGCCSSVAEGALSG